MELSINYLKFYCFLADVGTELALLSYCNVNYLMKGAKMNVYEIITEKILEKLDKGVVPWRKPWRGGSAFAPKSFATRKPYNGVNVWLLSMAAMDKGYQSPYWITYKKSKELGGQVRKGEKSTIAVFWKQFETEKTSDSGKIVTDKHFMLRYYNLFNIEQIDDLDESKLPSDAMPDNTEETLDFEPIEYCDNIVSNMPNRPTIEHSNERRAYYNPAADKVHLPNKEHFTDVPEYYSVAFHELAHSTGHESRLKRDTIGRAAFGSSDYSKEELVAEFAACFLCGTAGIETATIDNSASYIENWRKAIKANVKLVVSAAGKAQKAANYILGK